MFHIAYFQWCNHVSGLKNKALVETWLQKPNNAAKSYFRDWLAPGYVGPIGNTRWKQGFCPLEDGITIGDGLLRENWCLNDNNCPHNIWSLLRGRIHGEIFSFNSCVMLLCFEKIKEQPGR